MKTVLLRARLFVASVFVFLFCTGLVVAQTTTPPRVSTPVTPRADSPANPESPPLTSLEEEMRVKYALKHAEKEHKENLDRAREIGEIGKELQNSLKANSTLDREAVKKVERLEKLTRKIRGEAGGEDEDVKLSKRPTDLPSAVTQVAEASETLSKDVQNTPRQVVSASVIGNANVLLELIKILRAFVR